MCGFFFSHRKAFRANDFIQCRYFWQFKPCSVWLEKKLNVKNIKGEKLLEK